MRKDKSKKAILIIILILVVCFGIRFVMGKIQESKAEKESEKEYEEEYEISEKPAPVIQIEPKEEEKISEEKDEEGQVQDSNEPEEEMILTLNPEEEFYIADISDEIFERMKGKSFKDDCSLERSELRYIHVLHKTLDGETKEGELVVNYHIAKETLTIFRELYEADYPIEKICLIDDYDADDEKSMEDNNTSSFNFRFVPRTKKISKHGYGLAIDLNPLYNPYITTVDGKQNVEPYNATDYVDRDADFDYKITHEDLAFKVFTENGFAWGGDYKNSKDYQHFEIPSDKIREWYPGY